MDKKSVWNSNSLWNHYFDYSADLKGSLEEVYDTIKGHYEKSGHGFCLLRQERPHVFTFRRGRIFFSLFGLGSETLCRHTIQVRFSEHEQNVRVSWDIHLVLVGFSVGSNSLLKECDRLCGPAFPELKKTG